MLYSDVLHNDTVSILLHQKIICQDVSFDYAMDARTVCMDKGSWNCGQYHYGFILAGHGKKGNILYMNTYLHQMQLQQRGWSNKLI